MKYCMYLLLIALISCEKPEKETDRNTIYNQWVNYFDENNYKTYYHISSLAMKNNSNIIFSTFGCVDTSTIMFISNNDLINYDSNQFSLIDESFDFLCLESEKVMWYSNDLVIIHDKNAINCDYWSISDFNYPKQSSKYKKDSYNNIWLASIDGLKVFDGQNWESYYKGYTFRAICFDNEHNLYASTLPDFDEPGVILKYDYKTWDTLAICSGKAKWVPCMDFDNENNLWFGVLSRWAVIPESGDGLYKYDGNNFTHFHIYNSELPSNSIIDIAIDEYNNKWIGTYSGGLAKLNNNEEWKIFNTDNTPMPFNSIEHIIVDNENNIWLAIQYYGLAKLME